MRVVILGAGAMGSALTIPLAERNEVRLWGTEYDTQLLDLITSGKEHPRIMAKVPKEVEIFYPEVLKDALDGADVIVLSVSTAGVKPILERIKPYLNGREIVVTVTKGLIEEGNKVHIVAEYIEKKLGNPVVAITGPSIAREVANKNYTKVVFSSKKIDAAKKLKRAFETEYYFIELSDDVIGCELAAAFKNIYSIALAWPNGLEKSRKVRMNNLRGILFTQALRELAIIVEKFHGRKETIYGLSGIGDMACTAGGGRNGMLGELLGEGKSAKEALEILKERGVGVVEGYQNTPVARKMVRKFEHKLPLFRAVYQLLFEEKRIDEVIHMLISKS